jgi:hypothetical protein
MKKIKLPNIEVQLRNAGDIRQIYGRNQEIV